MGDIDIDVLRLKVARMLSWSHPSDESEFSLVPNWAMDDLAEYVGVSGLDVETILRAGEKEHTAMPPDVADAIDAAEGR